MSGRDLIWTSNFRSCGRTSASHGSYAPSGTSSSVMASARLRMDAYLRASMANLIGPTPRSPRERESGDRKALCWMNAVTGRRRSPHQCHRHRIADLGAGSARADDGYAPGPEFAGVVSRILTSSTRHRFLSFRRTSTASIPSARDCIWPLGDSGHFISVHRSWNSQRRFSLAGQSCASRE